MKVLTLFFIAILCILIFFALEFKKRNLIRVETKVELAEVIEPEAKIINRYKIDGVGVIEFEPVSADHIQCIATFGDVQCYIKKEYLK